MELSRTKYMLAVKCERLFQNEYSNANDTKEKSNIEAYKYAKITKHLVRDLYDGGIDVSENGNVFGKKAIEKTRQLILSGHRVLYNAVFEASLEKIRHMGYTLSDTKIYFTADITIFSENSVKIISVSNSNKINEPFDTYKYGFNYLTTLHCSIFNDMKIKQNKIEHYLLLINKNYVFKDELNLEALFNLVNITYKAKNNFSVIFKNLLRFKKIINKISIPSSKTGPKCIKNGECKYYSKCFKGDLSSVKNISNMSKFQTSKFEKNKIRKIEDIPDDTELTKGQWTEVKAYLDRGTRVKYVKIYNHLKQSINNESIGFLKIQYQTSSIPRFNGTSPNQIIPTCFYIKNENNLNTYVPNTFLDSRLEFIHRLIGSTEHIEKIYIYDDQQIRLTKEEIIEILKLKKSIKKEDKYVYSYTYLLNSLAKSYPEYSNEINLLLNKLINVADIFNRRYFYNSKQRGLIKPEIVFPLVIGEDRCLGIFSNRTVPESVLTFKHLFSNQYSIVEQIQNERELIQFGQNFLNCLELIVDSFKERNQKKAA